MERNKTCNYCGQNLTEISPGVFPDICPHCGVNFSTGLKKPTVGFAGILSFFFTALFFFNAVIFAIQILDDKEPALSFILMIISIGIGIAIFSAWYSSFKKDTYLYKLAESNPTKYVEEINKMTEEGRAKADKQSIQTQTRLAHTPACPICGSKHNVVRVTALDRSVSTAVWGVASDAIGKQWECTACHHKFNANTVVQQPTAPTQPSPTPTPDPTEELRKYKKLLDDGIITQEDFEKKKNQLLGL